VSEWVSEWVSESVWERERERETKKEIGKDRMRNFFFLFTVCPSWYFSGLVARCVSTLISEILNVHPHHRERREMSPSLSLSPFVSFCIFLSRHDSTPECTRVFTRVCVRLRLRTISAQHRPPMYHLTRC